METYRGTGKVFAIELMKLLPFIKKVEDSSLSSQEKFITRFIEDIKRRMKQVFQVGDFVKYKDYKLDIMKVINVHGDFCFCRSGFGVEWLHRERLRTATVKDFKSTNTYWIAS